MRRKQPLDRLLHRYGQTAFLTRRSRNETEEIKAFIQPVRKQREDLPMTATPLGAVSSQRWLYIGSRNVEVTAGDNVDFGSEQLVVQEARAVWLGGDILYYWAMLRRKKESGL